MNILSTQGKRLITTCYYFNHATIWAEDTNPQNVAKVNKATIFLYFEFKPPLLRRKTLTMFSYLL